MGFRFRRRVKLFPGVHINVTGKGISSVSIGGPGATVNLGKNMRVTATVGLPGTGISYRQTISPGIGLVAKQASHSCITTPPTELILPSKLATSVPNFRVASWSDPSLSGLQQLVMEAQLQHLGLVAEIWELNAALADAESNARHRGTWYRKLFRREAFEGAMADVRSRQSELNEAEAALADQGVAIDWTLSPRLKQIYETFVRAIHEYSGKTVIWHVHGASEIDRVKERTAYNHVLDRSPAKFENGWPTFMRGKRSGIFSTVPCLRSEAGLTVYFFPTFVAVEKGDQFGLVHPKNLMLDWDSGGKDIVEQRVPLGSRPADYTWKYVNKDGTRDLRFKDNAQIPIVTYEPLAFEVRGGFRETFYFSAMPGFLSEWLSLCDWFEAAEIRNELEDEHHRVVTWKLRREEDGDYVAAFADGTEVFAFAFLHVDDQLWVGLVGEAFGVSFLSGEHQDTPPIKVLMWLDEEQIDLGTLDGITRSVSSEQAAHKVWPQLDPAEPGPAPWEQLVTSNELLMHVQMAEQMPINLKLSLADARPLLATALASRMAAVTLIADV